MHTKNNALLPNLKTLTLDTPCDVRNLFLWIRTFLSSSLVTIEVAEYFGNTPMISYLEASTWLRYITAICTNLEALSLFPDSDCSNVAAGEAQNEGAMLDWWDSSLPQYLKQMTILRKLACTTKVLMPDVLEQLAKLTQLESLTIYPATGALKISDDVSKYIFLSLRHFRLCSCNQTLINDI